jgi:hypothetical protein
MPFNNTYAKVYQFFYAEASTSAKASTRPSVVSLYEDLWEYTKQGNKTEGQEYHFQPDNNVNDDPIYDEVESMIPSNLPPGAKIIPVEEPASAYDEVIINDGEYNDNALSQFFWEVNLSDAPDGKPDFYNSC